MSNIVYDALLMRAPPDRKRTPGGWTSFNGPCCVNNGQMRPDTRKRAGLRLSPEGTAVYHCFNCAYSATWQPGRSLSNRMKRLLSWMGTDSEELKKINFKIWQLHENVKADNPIKEWVKLEFKETALPKQAKPIMEWLNEGCTNKDFIEVLQYLAGRGSDLLTSYDYYWTPHRENDLHRRLIIPFRWQGTIVGYTARAIFPTRYRYFTDVQPNYIFNTEVLDNDWKYVFLNEGPFDGIASQGLAFLGNHITDEQVTWVKNSGKIPIVIPDREKGGGTLVDVAIREGWHVSFPKWDPGVKDAADAVKLYGRLYTVWSIIDSMTNNKLQINIERQRLR